MLTYGKRTDATEEIITGETSSFTGHTWRATCFWSDPTFEGHDLVASHIGSNNTGGWRLTIAYRQLNHVVENQSWQIPNTNQMLTRIGSKKYVLFDSHNLNSEYYHMPLTEEFHSITVFIT